MKDFHLFFSFVLFSNRILCCSLFLFDTLSFPLILIHTLIRSLEEISVITDLLIPQRVTHREAKSDLSSVVESKIFTVLYLLQFPKAFHQSLIGFIIIEKQDELIPTVS